ncbi:unnamed protein product [Kluyveromyces dobzhanskii CBS 2104]|uniref:WGS project CCBQ000000000 data, contig 00016 n=1 Tax=Kluyveromyces dobzhanskii CBS 2104 TaxID=1427455 RepID=A0A0A8L082_9SACH|nr:unnamed protein product [Kluyveromyces dobzhanskii CBS 2104]
MVKQVLQDFFSSKRLYFVCGKVYEDMHFANRIVHWFAQHQLPVIPINPKGGTLDLSVDSVSKRFANPQVLNIEKSIADGLAHYGKADQIDGISVAFVTPPSVTLSILQQLENLPQPVVSAWFQPGSWDLDCVRYATEDLQIPEERVINDCLLIKGHQYHTKSELQ